MQVLIVELNFVSNQHLAKDVQKVQMELFVEKNIVNFINLLWKDIRVKISILLQKTNLNMLIMIS